MSELLLTSSIDPIKEGQVFSKGLPRHVTVWQYFNLPDSHNEEFINDVGAALEGFSPLEIIGADNAEFGPRNDTLVRRVNALGRGAALTALHTVLGAIIEQHEGSVRNPEWTYENYNPHVTYVEGRALDEGERVRLRTVELIEKDLASKDKIVRKIWELEEA